MDHPGLDRFGAFVNRRQLAALDRALLDGERVLHVLEATHGRRGVLAATDRRLVFATGGLLRRRALAWPYRDVAGLKVVKAVDDAELTVQLRDGAVAFPGCRKREAEAFAEAVRKRPPGPDDPLDFTPEELRPKTPEQARREQLGRMLRKGSLTRAEYERRLRTLDD